LIRIWKLHIEADKYTGFQPSDLRYFVGRFECKPLNKNWEPQPAAIVGRSKPLADFASWATGAPTVSERSRSLISELAGSDVEFLSFHMMKNIRYYVLNVLRCENYLDLRRSKLDTISSIYTFKKGIPQRLPPIFKCKGELDEVFVSSEFAEMMVANRLRGASLADPAEPTFPLILRKAEINRYPGLTP
jgi:hypothetical protein